MKKNSGIVLIHGAGLNESVWNKVTPKLNKPALKIRFSKRSEEKPISFDEYLRSAIRQVEQWDDAPGIIIAHSIGGCLGIKLQAHFKDSVRGFIGISAVIPKSGQSFTDCFPFPQNYLMPILLKLFGTKPPDKSIEKELCNDLSPDQAKEIIQQFSPESVDLYTTKIKYGSLPANSLYLKLMKDQAIPTAMQSRMAENLGAQQITDLESGHLPMLSQPDVLAKVINEFTEKTAPAKASRSD